MRKLLLLTTALVATPASADTVTVGYLDPGAGMGAIQVLGTATGASPMVQLLGNPIFPTGPTGFGFDHILAMYVPPGGNSLSGGLGGSFPTLEFTFNDGFSPPQGGTAYLYATFQGTYTGTPLITLPTHWGVIETPAIGTPGYTVTTQVLICNTSNPFCGPFVGGISQPMGFAGQDSFTTLSTQDITLTSLLPGQQYEITEVFAFTGLTHPPFAQGDVGAVIETTLNSPVHVPAPIVGTGPVGFIALLLLWLKRRKKCAPLTTSGIPAS